MSSVTTAVIPAAGIGTRFLPATKAQPKEMLTVVDKPVIQYVVEEAVASGIQDIIVVTGQSKRAIEDHFDQNFELEMRLKEQGKTSALKEVRRISELANFIYVRQREPRGDGHAILEAEPLLRGRPFAILSGDDIIDSPQPLLKEMSAVYDEFKAPVVAVSPIPRRRLHHYGVISGINIRRRLYQLRHVIEKPTPRQTPSNLAIVFRYIVNPEFLETMKRLPHRRRQEFRMTDALARYIIRHPAYGFVADGIWHDCGSKLGLLQATVTYGLKHDELKGEFKRFLKTI